MGKRISAFLEKGKQRLTHRKNYETETIFYSGDVCNLLPVNLLQLCHKVDEPTLATRNIRAVRVV
jgi:hypothetical protein